MTTVTWGGEAMGNFAADPQGIPVGYHRWPESQSGNHCRLGLKKISWACNAGSGIASEWLGALETRLVRSDGCWTTGLASQNPTSLSPAPSEPFRNGTAQLFLTRSALRLDFRGQGRSLPTGPNWTPRFVMLSGVKDRARALIDARASSYSVLSELVSECAAG